MSHYTSQPGPIGWQTALYWLQAAPERLVVLVDGFGMKGVGAWGNPLSLAQSVQGLRNADILHFPITVSHRSVRGLGETLARALETLSTTDGANYLLSRAGLADLRGPGSYREIRLVGYSVGAVVARAAQLFGAEEQNAWVEKSSVALVAPVLKGARLKVIAEETLGSWKLPVLAGLLARYPILWEVEEGNTVLKGIEDEIREISQGREDFWRAVVVRWAEQDAVAVRTRFLFDPLGETVPNAGHFDVVSPSASRPAVLNHLAACIG